MEVEDLKSEIHCFFATKADLLTWKIETIKDIDAAIKSHVAQDHKVSIIPRGRMSLMPKGRLSKTQRNALIGALIAILTGIGAALKHYFG